MGPKATTHSRDMMNRAFLSFALSLALVACFAKTTSLGSGADPLDGSGPDAASGDHDGGSAHDVEVSFDGGPQVDAHSSGIACQIANSMLPVAPCPTGEYCRSDDGSCGSPAHCTVKPPPPPPFCAGLECGCDGVIRCKDYSRSEGSDVGPSTPCGVPCGPKTCDGVTEYCMHGVGGPMAADGGASTYYMCQPIPSACAISHTCACLQANTGSSGTCTEKGGRLDYDVPLP